MDTFSATVMLFLIMDPLGNVPTFLSVLKDIAPRRRRIIIVRELFFALVILLLFLFLGQYLLDFLKLKQESISIAGGIVLFLIALKMIFPSEGGVVGATPEGEPFIVPLAIPLVAGPSTLAACCSSCAHNRDECATGSLRWLSHGRSVPLSFYPRISFIAS